MTATVSNRSQKCWGRRPHFPFGGLLTTAETERWIFWVHQWLMWPVCRFPGQAQQPSDFRCLLFLWQLDRRCACWPGQFIILRDFVGLCLVRRCTCLCGSAANVCPCISVGTVACLWASRFPFLQNQLQRFLCCRNRLPFLQLSAE